MLYFYKNNYIITGGFLSMSNARIEKLFSKIQETNDKLDALYLERRQAIEQLSDCYDMVDKLKEEKATLLPLLASTKRDLTNYYERIKNYQDWEKRQSDEKSKLIAAKNISVLEQNISKVKSRLTIYEEKNSKIQTELDKIYLKIKELNIRKSSTLDEIKVLKQKKIEYKNSIDNLKSKHK